MSAAAKDVALLRSMMLIRSFETALNARADRGFQLFSSGQEAVAVGLCDALTPHDQLLTSGRSIGPALARGLDPGRVMAELIGKSAGPNKGKGGRGHLAQPSAGFFGAHAVVGGNLTIAAGVALSVQMQVRPAIVACLFGDGACGAGSLHETLNIATLWRLPLLLVCDNNQYSISTPSTEALAPERLSDFAKPFGIPAETVDGMDVLAVRDAAARLIAHVRSGAGPAFLECVSVRFASHSTSTRDTRSRTELEAAKARCPIKHLSNQLLDAALASATELSRLEEAVTAQVARACTFADAAPYPERSEALTDVS